METCYLSQVDCRNCQWMPAQMHTYQLLSNKAQKLIMIEWLLLSSRARLPSTASSEQTKYATYTGQTNRKCVEYITNRLLSK